MNIEEKLCKKYLELLSKNELDELIKEIPNVVKYLDSFNLHEILELNLDVIHSIYSQLTYGDIKYIITTYENHLYSNESVNPFNTLCNVMRNWTNIDEQYDFFYTLLPLTTLNNKVRFISPYYNREKQIFLSFEQISHLSNIGNLYYKDSSLTDCIDFHIANNEDFVYELIYNAVVNGSSDVYDLCGSTKLEYPKLLRLIKEIMVDDYESFNYFDILIYHTISMYGLKVFHDTDLDIRTYQHQVAINLMDHNYKINKDDYELYVTAYNALGDNNNYKNCYPYWFKIKNKVSKWIK